MCSSDLIYLWTIPAKIAGLWNIKVDGAPQVPDMELTQNYHLTNGTLVNGRGQGISDVSVKGDAISFSIWNGSIRHHYRGKVHGSSMSGMVNLNGREAKWQAVKATPFR